MSNQDLYKRLNSLNSEELIDIISNEGDYTLEAINIAHQIIEEKGGVTKIKADVELTSKKKEEKKKIINEIIAELNILPQDELKNADLTFTSEFLNREEIQEIFNKTKQDFIKNKKQDKITVATVFKLLIGILTSSILGAILLFAILNQEKTRIPVILFIIVIALNFAIIRWISGLRKLTPLHIIANTVALIISVLFLKSFFWLLLTYLGSFL